jgi:hypothetical protein
LKLKTRVLLYLILFVLACAPLAAGQTQPESAQVAVWSRYTYPGEEFSVELPGVPTVFNTVRAINTRRFGEEKGRVFRTGRHAYFALAVSVEEGRPEVGRFLDSFTLGASPAGHPVAEEEPVPRFVPPKTTTPKWSSRIETSTCPAMLIEM